ncbi:hypothetical protein ACNQGB_16525 [Flavobacterium sp. XS1P32]|uniref:hypothetical protein n=1 Tax=Flavobacterium sp. XS1P32 TaxID=3401726 RepID=UPI003AAD9E26
MKLTDEQIRKGYWYYNPDKNFPPNGKLLDEYTGEESLNLFSIKGNESISQIKNRENFYAINIPSKLNSLKILWTSHINQEIFDSICQLEKLESLYIESGKILNINAISNLKNLKHLGLLSLTKVENIKPLATLTQLETLELENLKKISDFKLLSELINLKGLQIDGDMYTAQRIENFNFLKPLSKLKYLTFTNSKANDKNFNAISKLENLEMLQSSTNYPKKEFQKLCGMKNLKYIGENIKHLINN